MTQFLDNQKSVVFVAISLEFCVKLICFSPLATLPIDHIQENYVREVQDCIFSVGYPTPFKSRVLLVAVSEVRNKFFEYKIAVLLCG